MIFIFCFFLAYSESFLDPYELDNSDLQLEEKEVSYKDELKKEAFDSLDKSIKTDKIFLWPKYLNTNSYSALGADFFYSFNFDSDDKNTPTLAALSFLFGSNDYLDTKFLFDSFWYSDLNNLTLIFSSNTMTRSYYETGMLEPANIGSYNTQSFDFSLRYRRKFNTLNFGIAYILKSINSDTGTEYENLKNVFLSGFSIGVDNKKCTNLLYKEAKFSYSFYYNSFFKFIGSKYNLNSLELDLEKTFLVSTNNFLIVSYFYKTYLSDEVPYLAMYSPYGLLRPYSSIKYLGKEYMSFDADLRVLFFKNTYLSLNGAGFQTRNNIKEFLLDDFMYSYGLGLLFPVSKNIFARIDFSKNKDENGFYISLSN